MNRIPIIDNFFYSGFWLEDENNYNWIHFYNEKYHPFQQYDKKRNKYFIRCKIDYNFKIDIDIDQDEILKFTFEIRKNIIYVTNIYNINE